MASELVCTELDLRHIHVRIDASSLGSGDLAGNKSLDVAPASEWWPYRNQMLLTFAAQALLPHKVDRLLIGTVRSDGFHKDGTTDFLSKFDDLLRYQEGGIRVSAPAVQLTSSELVKTSGIEMRLLAYCHSCHTGNISCGYCRGCTKHRQVMHALGIDAY